MSRSLLSLTNVDGRSIGRVEHKASWTTLGCARVTWVKVCRHTDGNISGNACDSEGYELSTVSPSRFRLREVVTMRTARSPLGLPPPAPALSSSTAASIATPDALRTRSALVPDRLDLLGRLDPGPRTLEVVGGLRDELQRRHTVDIRIAMGDPPEYRPTTGKAPTEPSGVDVVAATTPPLAMLEARRMKKCFPRRAR